MEVKECTYVYQTECRCWHGYDSEYARKYTFYRKDGELHVHRAISYFHSMRAYKKDWVCIEDFISFWLDDSKWYAEIRKEIRFNNLLKKIPELKAYFAAHLL